MKEMGKSGPLDQNSLDVRWRVTRCGPLRFEIVLLLSLRFYYFIYFSIYSLHTYIDRFYLF